MTSKIKRLTSLILATVMMIISLPVSASYNGGSTSGSWDTSGSGKNSSASSLVSFGNQMIKCSLYFCQISDDILNMPTDTKEERELRRQKMDEVWAKGKTIQKVGDTIYIGRPGIADSGKYKYEGDIASSDLFDRGFVNESGTQLYQERTPNKGGIIFKTTSELGFTEPESLPVTITNNNIPAGKEVKEYFMSDNTRKSDYDASRMSKYDTKENMRKLIHAMTGRVADPTGQTNMKFNRVSFSKTENGTDYYNSYSDFDSGTYNGQSGEYKLYLESCITIGTDSSTSTAMTVRDAAYHGFVSGPNASERRNNQPNTMKFLAHGFKLTADDAFGLKKAKHYSDFTKTTISYDDLVDKLDADEGYGVNILSSELFRIPTRRGIGSHVDVFLDIKTNANEESSDFGHSGNASAVMEFIGNAKSKGTTVANNMSKELILESLDIVISAGDAFGNWLYNKTGAIGDKIKEETGYNDYKEELTENSEETESLDEELEMIYGVIEEGGAVRDTARELDEAIDSNLNNLYEAIDKGSEIFNAVTKAGDTISNTAHGLEDAIVETYNQNAFSQSANGAFIENLKQEDVNKMNAGVTSENYAWAQDPSVLNKYNQVVHDYASNNYKSSINQINQYTVTPKMDCSNNSYIPYRTPIVTGTTGVAIFGEGVNSVGIPKGLIGETSKGLLSYVGDAIKQERLRIYDYLLDVDDTDDNGKTVKKDINVDNVSIEEAAIKFLGGDRERTFQVDHATTTSVDNVTEKSDSIVTENYLNSNSGYINKGLVQATLPIVFPNYMKSLKEYNQNVGDKDKLDVLTVKNTSGASYGLITDNKIYATYVDALALNNVLEGALTLAPSIGERVVKPQSYINAGNATGTRTLKEHLNKVYIEPLKALENVEVADTNTESSYGQAGLLDIAVNNKNNFVKDIANKTRSSSNSVWGDNKTAKFTYNPEVNYINFMYTNSKNAASIVNETVKEGKFNKVDIRGEYGISYNIYDEAIPVDVVLATRTEDGIRAYSVDASEIGLTEDMYSRKEAPFLIPNVAMAVPGEETLFKLDNNYKINTSAGKFEIDVSEAIVKPACVDWGTFISKVWDTNGSKLKNGTTFNVGRVDCENCLNGVPHEDRENTYQLKTTLKVADKNGQFPVTKSGIRVTGFGESEGTVGDFVSEDKTYNGITFVANQLDQEYYKHNTVDNRLTVVLVCDIIPVTKQYNIIDMYDERGICTTTITEHDVNYVMVKNDYSDGAAYKKDRTQVQLVNKIGDAKFKYALTYGEDIEPAGWEEVENHGTPKSELSSYTGKWKISDDKKNVDTVYVHYEGRKSSDTLVEPSIRISESRVTQSRNLSGPESVEGAVGDTQLGLGNEADVRFSWNKAQDDHGYEKPCSVSWSDAIYKLVTSNASSLNKTAIATNGGVFNPVDSNNIAHITRDYSPGSELMHPEYKFITWRGYDIPVLASYKYANTHEIESLLKSTGLATSTIKNKSGNSTRWSSVDGYEDSFNIRESKVSTDVSGDAGDYTAKTNHSRCSDKTYSADILSSFEYDTDMHVDVFYGNPNSGTANASGYISQNLRAFGQEYMNVKGTPIKHDVQIKFWPYVEMLYDTNSTKNNSVYVLGGHESAVAVNDYVEVGYLTARDRKVNLVDYDNGTGLRLESQQWSTHSRAQKLSEMLDKECRKNSVLPGGAIYRLRTPTNGSGNQENARTQVVISNWFTFLPTDTENAVTAGATSYSGSAGNDRKNHIINSAEANLENLNVVLNVNGTDVIHGEKQKIDGTASKTGGGTSTDTKYELQLVDGNKVADTTKANQADLDIVKTQKDANGTPVNREENIYYRVYSDTKGNVYVSKSTVSASDTAPGKGTILGMINKTESFSDLVKNWETDANANEIMALNNRTKIVENFINAIDRNIGYDETLGEDDNTRKWYNEAFDGICVKRVNTMLELGFSDGNAGADEKTVLDTVARTSVIDPKLQAVAEKKADRFTAGVKAYFHTQAYTGNNNGKNDYIGTAQRLKADGTTENVEYSLVSGTMDDIMRSRDFIIPNASVMDLSY